MWTAISQRHVKSEFGDYRDSLENTYTNYYESLGIKLIPIPNSSKDMLNYFKDLPIERVILTGGQDINPSLYNQRSTYAKDFSNLRDKTEMSLLEIAIEKNLPVFCNCRGMQFMNVFFGGSLIQNIEKQYNGRIKHVATSHEVEVVDKEAYKFLKKRHFIVNSYHNQGISKNNLSKELLPFAVSSEDQIIEGIYHPNYPIAGVQWHPERKRSDKKVDLMLIEAFIKGKLFWKK